MFDFEQLSVYQKALGLNKEIYGFLKLYPGIDYFLQNQIKRAGVSSVANIAEGVGRFTVADRRHFYVIARGSVFEVYSLLQVISSVHTIEPKSMDILKMKLEEFSKMLFGLIKKTEIKSLNPRT